MVQMEIREHGKTGEGFVWAGITGKGKVREMNEDVFAVEEDMSLFTVSDGIGGHAGGEVAAGLIKEHWGEIFRGKLKGVKKVNDHEICKVMRGALGELNKLVLREWQSEGGFMGTGATVVTGFVAGDKLYCGNAGDSSMYLLRDGKLRQLSKEHSFTHELFEKGRIKLHEKLDHPYSGVITQHVGMESGFKPFVRKVKLEGGDRILLCSDGLTDMVEEKVMRAVLVNERDCERACESLYEKAMGAGGYDNITIVVADKSDGSRSKQ